jgi:hypothetical protein
LGKVLTTPRRENISSYEIFTDKDSDLDWGDPGVDRRIILRWIFRKWDVGIWTGLSCFKIGTGGGHL